MTTELMHRIAHGSRAEADEAFAELVSIHSARLTSFAFRRLRDWQQSEDIAQAVLLSVWQHAHTYIDGSAFGGWLYRIAERKVIDATRRRKCDALANRVQPTDDCDPLDRCCVDAVDPADVMSAKETLAEIDVARKFVPPEQMATLDLACEGWSLPDIAAASGTLLSTTKGRVRCAKEKLRRMITHDAI